MCTVTGNRIETEMISRRPNAVLLLVSVALRGGLAAKIDALVSVIDAIRLEIDYSWFEVGYNTKRDLLKTDS